MNSERAYLEAVYKLFNKFALDDQRAYYEAKLSQYRQSASQVNTIRAVIGFITGFASAAAGLIVQTSFTDNGSCLGKDNGSVLMGAITNVLGTHTNCDLVQQVSTFLVLVGIITPAIGVGFNILSDLFQWDRLITVYDSALENIEVADARSPDPEMDDVTYSAALHAFAEGTLSVMYDETAQWGQLIRTPQALEKFIADEQQIADKASGGATTQAATENNPLPSIHVPTIANPATGGTNPANTGTAPSANPAPPQAGLAASSVSGSGAASNAPSGPPPSAAQPDNSPPVG